MCHCKQPNVNGQPGYSYAGQDSSIYPTSMPEVSPDDEIIRDLPGRCGHIDSHACDLRLVKRPGSGAVKTLLVGHGSWVDEVPVRMWDEEQRIFESLSDDDAYWMLMMIYRAAGSGLVKGKRPENRSTHLPVANGKATAMVAA